MANRKPPPIALQDLEELYRRLVGRLDRLEGTVRQLLAEGTRDTLDRPSWRDIDELRKQIQGSPPPA